MKKIKILGTGCPKCKQTYSLVESVVNELNLPDVDIEKVDDIMKFIEYNVLTTPAIIIDEELIISGRVPSHSELKDLLA